MHQNMKYLKAAYDGQKKCNLHGPGHEKMDSLTKVQGDPTQVTGLPEPLVLSYLD